MKYGTMSYLCYEDKVLMVKKKTVDDDLSSGFYTLPGGKLSDNEMGSHLDGRVKSVIRKTEEQTGIRLINPILRGTIFFYNQNRMPKNGEKFDDFLFHLYVSQSFLKIQDTDYKVHFWMSKEVIPKLMVPCGDKKMYEWISDGRNFSGTICYAGDKLDFKRTFVDWFN